MIIWVKFVHVYLSTFSGLKRSFFQILSRQRCKLYKSSGNKKVNWTFFLNLGPIKNKMMNSKNRYELVEFIFSLQLLTHALFISINLVPSLYIYSFVPFTCQNQFLLCLKFSYLFNINSSRITICHCSFSTLLLPF